MMVSSVNNSQIKLPMNLNVLPRYKDKSESSFRVHFYLKNVYYSGESKLPVFLQDTATRISKVVEASIVQIYGSVRKIVDLSVGLKTDQQAASFLQSHRKLVLPGEFGKMVEHEPVISQTFKNYLRQTQERQTIERQAIERLALERVTLERPTLERPTLERQTLERQETLAYSTPQKKQASLKHEQLSESLPKKNSEQESILKKYQGQNQRYQLICIFAIPLEFKEREVVAMLGEKGIKVKFFEWKFKEDMEFMLVEMTDSLTEREISALDLRIEKYPLLVMPKVHEEFVNPIIMKLQLELNFQKDIDEAELMTMADKVGGVISMVKDEFYGPRKYNIAFNNPDNLARFQQAVQKHYKGCRLCKPRYIIRICRLQKSFTFCQMMENLALYELQLRKIKRVSPEKTEHY